MRMFALFVAAALALACTGGGEPARTTEAPLLSGRTIPIDVYDPQTGEVTRERMNVGAGEVSELIILLARHCQLELADRFEAVQPSGGDPQSPFYDSCALGAATEAIQQQLCVAYRMLAFAEALQPTDIYDSGPGEPVYFRSRRPGDAPDSPDLPGGDLVYSVPVLTGSDAASAAMSASRIAQGAARVSALALAVCPADELASTLPASDGGTTTLAHVTAIAVNESSQLMIDAARIAERTIAAAAQQRFADDRDEIRARIESWRARQDSRLEIAAMWVGVPEALFEPEPTGPGAPLLSAGSLYPVVTRAHDTEALNVAEQLLRETAIDPRSDPGAESVGLIDERLRAALATDYPAVFDDSEHSAMSTAEFIRSLGTTPADLRLAARTLVEESAVLGRPIEPTAESTTVPRVIGTSPRFRSALPGYLAAITVGRDTRDDGETDSPGTSYQNASIAATIDVARANLRKALRAGELPADVLSTIDVAERLLSNYVEVRARVCVGTEHVENGTSVQDKAVLRLYGVPSELSAVEAQEIYSLWWGDNGLRCALDGSVEGRPCDPDHYRISTVPTREPEVSGSDSGLGGAAFQWEILPSHLPMRFQPATGLPASGRIYVTASRLRTGEPGSGAPTTRQRFVVGFGISQGTATGTYSRCTFIPGGSIVEEVLDRVLAADAEEPDAPASTCAGVPLNQRLPIEDEFAEAGTSGGVVEQVFLSYLRRAEEAAARAEHLGERLIGEQLEMNSIADQAASRLNQICGTNFSANLVPLEPPGACTTSADCASGHCELGRCIGSVADLLDGDSADVARLRRCLGDGEELVEATMGRDPLCGWYLATGELCGCPAGEDCSALSCLVPGDCSAVNEVLPGDPTQYRTFRSTALAIVPPGSQSRGVTMSCLDVARLRSELEPESSHIAVRLFAAQARAQIAERIRQAPWLNQQAFVALAQSLAMNREFGGFATVSRGGRPWLQTGSLASGPNIAGFPCGPHSEITEAEPGLAERICGAGSRPNGRSLLCGAVSAGVCETPDGRALVHQRLEAAIAAVSALSGVDVPVERATTVNLAREPHAVVPFPTWMQAAYDTSGTVEYYSRTVEGEPPVTFNYQCFRPEVDVLPSGPFPRCGLRFGFLEPAHFHSTARPAPFWRYVPIHEPNPFRSPPPTVDQILQSVRDRRILSGNWIGDQVFVRGGSVYDPNHRDVANRPVPFTGVLDALELACVSSTDDVGGCPADLSQPVQVNSVEDMVRLQAQLECVAERFGGLASRLVFPDIPVSVAEDIRSGQISGTYSLLSGEYGAEVATLRAQMENVVRASSQVSAVLSGFASDIATARSRLRQTDLERAIVEQQRQAEMFNNIFGCLAAASPSITAGVSAGVSWNTGSVFICINAGLQQMISDRIASLRDDVADETRVQIEISLGQQYSDRVFQLSESTRLLAESYATINATLARMAALRSEARASVARVLFLDSDDTGREYEFHRMMRGRLNRTRIQYEEAHRNAIQMSFLARRAIEQRIGMNLSRIGRASLGAPPAEWADTLCTLNGVDFYSVWNDPDTGLPPRDAEDAIPDRPQTVADYVARLKLYVDSYLLDYPFVNGTDTVVLSVRDDLLRPTVACSVDSYNVLLDSESLDNAQSGLGTWSSECGEEDEASCLVAIRRNDVTPFITRSLEPDGSGVSTRATRSLGGGTAFVLSGRCDGAEQCSGPELLGGWGQEVPLAEGTYLLSWYERDPECDGTSCAPRADAVVLDGPTSVVNEAVQVADPVEDRWINASMPGGWRRFFRRVEIPTRPGPVLQTYRVELRLTADAEPLPDTDTFQAVVAAPQLEYVDWAASSSAPKPYFPTDAFGRAPVGICADRTGAGFRNAWVRRCEMYCAAGVGTACAGGGGEVERCFYETDFTVSLGAIERGELIAGGGFAVGNFNYRTDSLALNVVGSGVRDCSGLGSPDACYSSAFIPFSLYHDGPFVVRNHAGDPYPIDIFAGRIQSAKALTAERQLTNPVSSADRALLGDYWRTEFRGRPLHGLYRARIYEVPGLDWSRVEDVQIALTYRYWTRQE